MCDNEGAKAPKPKKLSKKEQRQILKMKYGGRCAYCGEELGDRWHADHIKPVLRRSKVVYDENGRIARNDDGSWKYNSDVALPVGHGERSVILIQQNGFTLTLQEIAAIRWHMGAFDDAVRGGSREMSEAFRKYPIAAALHIADMEATYFDEREDVENARNKMRQMQG